MNSRIWILIAVIAIAIAVAFCFPAIPQSEAYHNFADKRAFLGVPNALNALSNIFFLFVGILGMRLSLRSINEPRRAFLDSRERWPYFVFFAGVALTAFGSTYYHLHPSDATLVWDRIHMAIDFMALVAAVIGERLCVKLGAILLVPSSPVESLASSTGTSRKSPVTATCALMPPPSSAHCLSSFSC